MSPSGDLFEDIEGWGGPDEGARIGRDNQRTVNLGVYQGESRLVRDNILLGSFNVAVPRAPAGNEAIDVRFTYDTSGLLEVEATVVSSGCKASLVVEGNPGELSREEIRARLRWRGRQIFPKTCRDSGFAIWSKSGWEYARTATRPTRYVKSAGEGEQFLKLAWFDGATWRQSASAAAATSTFPQARLANRDARATVPARS